MKIGYSDFVKLCRVDDPETWVGWLSLRGDGVYVKVPPGDQRITREERAVLTEHPTGNLTEPALRFPCTLDELHMFLEHQGVYGCIDAFDLADWVLSSKATPTCPSQTTVSGPSFAKLQAALEAFNPRNPPRSKKAFKGELETRGCDTREQEVFANIAAEHYGHSWRS